MGRVITLIILVRLLDSPVLVVYCAVLYCAVLTDAGVGGVGAGAGE